MTGTALWLSIRLAAVTTTILLATGAIAAFSLARWRSRFKPLVEATIALPLVMPPTVLGFYLLSAMGLHGPLGRIWNQAFHQRLAFTFSGLVLASCLYSLPFAVQPMQAAFESVNPRLLEASATLGASPWRTLRRVLLPATWGGIVAAGVLTFAHTLGEFGVVLMVGGDIPGQTRTVSIAVYDMVEALNYARAGKLSLALLALSYRVLAVFYAASRRWMSAWPKD